ncbi:UDP-N-acetylmuramoylalanyl-D-glutamate--2,6-diaminopimelate ligase [Streptomyces sp. PA03-6a]|uniref:glutamate ligase domain-containing protein n=1 Tax=Actinacidiphila glaucinigra TaxID=235986 RepID=UPI0029B98D35|nr:UDP-N-acetylmuramoylalanyl-D-glutamate--2,6-diaminopimelate ligase [Actinacidiphila glaucinigra]MDX2705637.1 UDP-N-acetylmuramoylalanyl-D-glutamate--2,6-diaminopimelate ligase [Streptomyces sp. PA03-6a]WSD65094.1 UDP-N-acetylmuramoylalanyl-D-glutamate--2,6-diaminopimelate ligase [Actinacidiphila glaucinigra]
MTDQETPKPRRTIAVLGEMYELGDQSANAHFQVGAMAGEEGIDFVIAVGGEDAKQIALGAANAGVDAAIVADNETATELVKKILQPGDIVLTKGSRGGMRWQIAQALTGQEITGILH